MKKYLFWLVTVILAFSLCACTNSEAKVSENEGQAITDITETQIATTEPSETIEQGIYEDYFVIGNYKFKIPDGFTASLIDSNKNAVILISDDTDCIMQFIASDISFLDEKDLPKIFSVAQETLDLHNENIFHEGETEGSIAGKNIKIRSYIKQEENLTLSICLDSSYTDSWYAYLVSMKFDSTSDKTKEFSRKFGYLNAFAEYLGESPRFDTVQYID